MTGPVVVTGATGFTGRRVVAALVRGGVDVVAFVRPSSDPATVAALGVRSLAGDLDRPATLRAALEGASALVNVASLGFGHAPGIVAAARDAGIRRSVFLGTTAVRTRLPASTKAVRLEAERVVLGGGVGATLLRPTMIYGGPGDRNLERLFRFVRRSPIVPILGRGAGLVQPTHVDDVAAAVAAVLPRADLAGRDFDVPGPLSLTFEALVRTVGAVLGHRRWYPHVPAFVGRLVASREQVLRLAEDKTADPTPARVAFGYAPRALVDGLRDEARALGWSS